MQKIIVEKSPPLKGTVRVSGAKNSALPILAASLLGTEDIILEDVPRLEDVKIICDVLRHLGAEVEELEDDKIRINSKNINNYETPYELVSMMRASFLVMGPLLARLGKTRTSMPGGCAIGTRPIDLHLKGFKALGAEIENEHGAIGAQAEKLIGDKIYLTRGAVYDFYEFESDKRYNDDEWRDEYKSGGAPERPAWTESFIVNK